MKNDEFDTSFLNDVKDFEDFNTDEVFSFDSTMDDNIKSVSDGESNVNHPTTAEEKVEQGSDAFDKPQTFMSFDDFINSNSDVSLSSSEDESSNMESNEDNIKVDEQENNQYIEAPENSFENGIHYKEDVAGVSPSNDNNVDEIDTEDTSENLTLEMKDNSSDELDESSEVLVEDEVASDKTDAFDELKKDDFEKVASEDTNNLENVAYDNFEKRLEELSKNTEPSKVLDDNVTTDINNLFVKVNTNVKEASDIFLKNVEMKKKIDERFDELKKLQASIEKSKKDDYDEINNYKDKVISELMEKKNEIELRLNTLKEVQSSLTKEKEDFEKYKRDEKTKLEDLKREADANYEAHKDELDKLENKLRKQKNALDEERRQLSLDQIQYESDKNELANNMLKFNEIVGTFTNGMDKLN